MDDGFVRRPTAAAFVVMALTIACGREPDVGRSPAPSERAPAPPPRTGAPEPTSPDTAGGSAAPDAPPRENPRVVTAGATTLEPASGAAVAGGECPLGGTGGYDRDGCTSAALSGGTVAALWERRRDGGEVAGTFRVTIYQRTSGGWTPRLRATFEPDTISGVGALEADIGGGPFLVVGYRHLGSGSDLSYDVVAWPRDGRVRVAGHRGPLSQGSLKIGDGAIVDYGAALGPSDAACCPSRFTRTTIAWSSGALRIDATSTVEPSAVPSSDL